MSQGYARIHSKSLSGRYAACLSVRLPISVCPGVRGGDYFFSSTTYNPILKPAAATACASRTGASQPSFYGTLTQSVTRAASSTRSELFDYRIQQFYYPPVRVRKKIIPPSVYTVVSSIQADSHKYWNNCSRPV